MSVQDKTGTSRRGQALSGALAGVAVIAVLVAVYIGIQVSDGAEPGKSAAASAPAEAGASAPAEPAPAPSQPPAAAQVPLDPALQQPPVVKGGKGKVAELKVTEIIAGKGPALQPGQTIAANYVGVTYKDGKEFDSSWKAGQPAQFAVGVGGLIKGWDQGLIGVKVGSRVQLDIPATLAYPHPQQGQPAGDLRFVVDVLAAQ